MTEAELSIAMYHTAQREMRAYRDAEMVDGVAKANTNRGGRKGRTGLTLEDYERCARAGMSMIEAARHLGVSGDAAAYFCRTYGVKFRDGRRKV